MPIEFHLILFLTCFGGAAIALAMIVGAALVFSVSPRLIRVRR